MMSQEEVMMSHEMGMIFKKFTPGCQFALITKIIYMKSLMVVAIITGIIGAVTLIYITDSLRKNSNQISE